MRRVRLRDRSPGADGLRQRDPVRVRLNVETRIEWVEVLLGIFERQCLQAGYDADAVHWMGTAVREAITNGMRHGNRMDPGRRLQVEIEIRRPGRPAPPVRVTVEDEGEGFEFDAVPDPLDENNLLKASGRGIFFMRHFMDQVHWTRAEGGGTRVELVHKTAPPLK